MPGSKTTFCAGPYISMLAKRSRCFVGDMPKRRRGCIVISGNADFARRRPQPWCPGAFGAPHAPRGLRPAASPPYKPVTLCYFSIALLDSNCLNSSEEPNGNARLVPPKCAYAMFLAAPRVGNFMGLLVGRWHGEVSPHSLRRRGGQLAACGHNTCTYVHIIACR